MFVDFLTPSFRELRARFLRTCIWCADCGEEAVDVRLKLPPEQGGKAEWHNLKAVCRRHASQQTQQEAADGALRPVVAFPKGVGRALERP